MPVFVKDSKGRYLLINEAAGARFVGKSAEELLGRDDTELFDAIGAHRVMSRDREILSVGEVVTVEDTLTSAGGTRSYDTTIAPYRDATGAVIGLIGIARDITERKRAEQAPASAKPGSAISQMPFHTSCSRQDPMVK